VAGQALRQRLGEVPQRAGIGHDAVAAWELHLRRQRPRARQLDLHQARLGVLGRLLERVQVAAQVVDGCAVVVAGPGGHPVRRGHHLHRQVDQQGGRAADRVRAQSSTRQLRQVWEVGKLADDDGRRLDRVGSWHGTDGGRGGGRKLCWHGANLSACREQL
jgi:hypothetical protein